MVTNNKICAQWRDFKKTVWRSRFLKSVEAITAIPENTSVETKIKTKPEA
jgi:hypothetical protein